MPKFDRKMSLKIRKIQRALTQNRLRMAIIRKTKKPSTMTTTVALCLKLESLYMTKSLVNKIHLKKHLYTFSMAKCTPIQNHLGKFNSIIIDLESLDVKLEDED